MLLRLSQMAKRKRQKIGHWNTRTYLLLSLLLVTFLFFAAMSCQCLLTSLAIGESVQSTSPLSLSNSSNFQQALVSISNAYIQIHKIEVNGGNASLLVPQLNVAIALYQDAINESSKNATQANIDLQNTTSIAGNLSMQASLLATNAEKLKQTRQVIAVAEALTIVTLAILVYTFGEEIYRRYWLNRYKNYSVKFSDGKRD